MTGRAARGAAALLVLIAAVAGIPALLLAVAGNPVHALPSWAQLRATLTIPDVSGGLFLTVLVAAGWLVWASFVVAVALEVTAHAGGVRAPRIRLLGAQQRVAAGLIAAVAAAVLSPALGATAAAAAARPAATVSVVDHAPTPAATHPSSGSPRAPDSARTATVGAGESLWEIADRTLGSGARWRELAAANYGRPQPGGGRLDRSHVLQPGWVLHVPAPTRPHTAAPVGREHVVRAGESLSQIAADTLGDGTKWPELRVTGHAGADPNLIQPGWDVTIPAPRREHPEPTHQHTGTPNGASHHTSSRPPATPNPGATTAHTGAPQRPPTRPARPVHPVPSATTPPLSAPAPTTQPAPTQDQAPAHKATPAPAAASTRDEGQEVPTVAVGGTGLLLGLGLLTALDRRRRRQRGRRRVGERIPMPTTPAGQYLETALRAGQDRDGAADITAAVQHLAVAAPTPPQLQYLALTATTVEVVLAEPAQLSPPWQPADTRTIWSTDRTDLPTPAQPGAPTPYPALLHIGSTPDGDCLLVNLEMIGHLNVTGPHAQDLLTAAALELAVSRDRVLLTTIGFGADLAEVSGPEVNAVTTLHPVITALEGRAADLHRALAETGAANLPQARVHGDLDDTAPHVLLIAEPITDPRLRRRLEQLTDDTPGLGVAAITTDPDHAPAKWSLTTRDDRTAVLGQITITPQLLDPDSYDTALQHLATSLRNPVPGPAWATNIPTLETAAATAAASPTALPTLTAAPTDTEPHAAPDDEPAAADTDPVVDVAAPDWSDNEDAAPLTQDITAQQCPTDQRPTGHDPARDNDRPPDDDQPTDTTTATPLTQDPAHAAAAAIGDHPADSDPTPPVRQLTQPAPRILVLGPVSIENTQGPAPTTSRTVDGQAVATSNHVQRALAALAFLALRPHAARSAEQLRDQLIGAGARMQTKSLTQLLSRTRSWLGSAPDGSPYVPVKTSSAPYRLHPDVTTDWHQLQQLMGQDPTTTPLDDLETALGLVRGAPMTGGVPERHLAWAEDLRVEMTSTIADLAHITALRALTERRYPLARKAVAVGRRIDPVSQDLWLDAIRVDLATGRSAAARDLANDLQAWADIEDIELIKPAHDLLEQVNSRAQPA